MLEQPEQIPGQMALPDPGRPSIGKFQRPGDAAATQRVAAIEAYTITGKARLAVLAAIGRSFSGMTDEEIQTTLDMNPSTERPRRVELVEGGWVEDSGDKRLTRSRRKSVVWALTSEGRQQLGELA